VAPYLLGLAGTGKSTVINTVMRIYESCDVYAMANNTQAQFSMANAYRCFLVVFPEVKKKLALEQATFQSAVTGEAMELPVKHQQNPIHARPWDVPLCMAGNELPDYQDAAGSVVRRLLVFAFEEFVTRSDPTLQDRLYEELPALIAKGLLYYLQFTCDHGNRGIWDKQAPQVLPDYFHDQKSQVTSDTNPLAQFIQSSCVTLDPENPNLYIPYTEFQKAYVKWCTDTGITNRAINRHNFKSTIANLRLKDTGSGKNDHVWMVYPSGSAYGKRMHGRFIIGMDIARPTVAVPDDDEVQPVAQGEAIPVSPRPPAPSTSSSSSSSTSTSPRLPFQAQRRRAAAPSPSGRSS
jgi:phage/plasmid-associated DNA primase